MLDTLTARAGVVSRDEGMISTLSDPSMIS
jgi:hypothetical protein